MLTAAVARITTMTKRQFRVLVDWDPEAQAWVTLVPGLDDLSTFGETREEALAHTREAILGYLEAARREGIPIPAETAAELVEVEVAMP
jgi:predicted RNase H-like HicB family nuclease